LRAVLERLLEASVATADSVYLPGFSLVVILKPPLVLRGRSLFVFLTDRQRRRPPEVRQRLTL
jgi:hypothetical protein